LLEAHTCDNCAADISIVLLGIITNWST